MRKNNEKKRFNLTGIFILVASVIIMGTFLVLLGFSYNKAEAAPMPVNLMSIKQPEDIQRLLDNLKTEQVILREIRGSHELITMEVDVTDDIVWDNTWGGLEIFKKSQKLRFYGTGIYTTDLSDLEIDDIIVNHRSKTLTLNLNQPVLKSVTIHEDKTEVSETENGWFRIGDMKMTAAQTQAMMVKVKGDMEGLLESDSMYDNARSNTITAISDIFTTILAANGDEGYTVNVNWN